MANILQNIAKIYLNPDHTEKEKINPFIGRGANGTYLICMVGAFNNQDSHYVNFGLSSKVPVDPRYMTLIGIENSDKTNNEDWYVWLYEVGGKILAGAAAETTSILDITFSQFANTTVSEQFEFIGFQSSEAELNVNFPTPSDDQYAGVGEGTTLGTAIAYLAVSGSWVNQNKTVLEFESENGILRESKVIESPPIKLTVESNISTVIDEEDNTNLDVAFKNISTLNGKVLDIETLLGVDGANFVKSALGSTYLESSIVESDDQFYVEKANGDKRRITFANLAEGTRENFIGTFDTASGLTCPDPDDLLCTWPNGIGDPDERLGWVASVLSTNTKWSWSSTSNAWIDTGLAPTLAKDTGYDPTSDQSTDEENVQDAMVEHGIKINTNKTDLDAQKLKTQKLNSDGDIAENTEVLPGKDISNDDLLTGTGLAGFIASIIANYTRSVDNETNISTNTNAILTKLQKDFSTLGSVVLEGADLFVIRDDTDGLNKKVSLNELASKIEGLISNDQGFYLTLAALQAAIPVGEDGWFATLGDSDTIGVWDSDTNNWVLVASKLYYSLAAGLALEIRVTAAELAIIANAEAIALKFDIANLTSDIDGNSTSETKAATPKGVFDKVKVTDDKTNENRTYSAFTQTNNFISRVASETTLFNGREERMLLTGGFQVAVGIAQISIDGGLVYKNIAIYIPGAGWVDADLSLGLFFGERFLFIFDTTRDKWLAFLSDQIVSRALGATYQAFMSIGGNYDDGQLRNARLDNLEENQGVPALQEVAINAPIIVTTNTIAHELVFHEATIPSNEPTILDVDGNFNHVIKSNTEPGLSFDFYAQIKNQGTPGSNATAVFYIANKSAPCNAGTFIVGKKYIINAVGTTDFTAIGASANTVGIVFVATGIGTGTGSALCIFRDIRITAVGQDEENDRGIPLKISNNDYIAPFTPGVYYTKEGVDYNILQTIFTCDTIFPSGNGPASSDTVILIDSATESRNGVETKQKGHNDESVVDRKDLLESGKVIVANYQAVGLYQANKPEIILTTNKIVRVLFSGQGTDLTELVTLSLDNGASDYDVEYRLTDVDLTVKNAVTHVMDLYFTGDKFIATYVDSVIANDAVPYNGPSGQFENPLAGVPIVIGEETSEEVEDVRGSTLSEIVKNPLFKEGTDGWTPSNAVLTVVDETLIITGSGGGTSTQAFRDDLLVGISTYLKGRVRDRSGLATSIQIRDSVGSVIGVIDNPTQDIWYDVSIVGITGADRISIRTNFAIAGDSNNAVTEVEYIQAIPTDLTLTEIEKLVSKPLDFGTWNAGQAKTFEQELDNRNKLGNQTHVGTNVVDESTYDVPVIAYGSNTGLDNYSYIDTTLEVDTVYTAMIWKQNYKPGSGTDSLSIFNDLTGSYDDIVTQSQLDNNAKNVILTTITTQSVITTNRFSSYFFSTGGTLDARIVLVKGDHTNKSEEEALRIIKDVESGEFTIQGITYKTVAKNKVDLLEQGSLSSGDGSEIASPARLRSVDYIPVIKGAQYTLKSYNQKDAVALNQIIMQYDSNKAFISTTGFTTNPLTLTLTSNTSYVRTIVKFVGDADIEVDDILQQLEIGADATSRETYKETFSWVDTGENGFAMLPNGVYDDELKQRTNPNYGLVDADFDDFVTTGTNTDAIILFKFNGWIEKGVDNSLASTQSLILEGFRNAAGYSDTVGAIGTVYSANTTRIGLLVAKGTYTDLADAKAGLIGTKVVYELAKYLDRTEANDNQAPKYGEQFIGAGHTYEVSVSQGVLPSRWSATSGVNTKSQVKANTDSIVRLAKELAAQGLSINEINIELNKLADEIGYTPDLLTSAKILVDAINELLLDLALTDNEIVTIKGAGWVAETIKANNTLILALQAKVLVDVTFTGTGVVNTSPTKLGSPNVTGLTKNIGDYDYAELTFTTGSKTFIIPKVDLNNATEQALTKLKTSDGSTMESLLLNISKDSDTTMTLWNAKEVVATFSGGISASSDATLTLTKIKFGKY